jgi:DNA gyrase/topoisomerase IV subunit A
VLTIKNSASQSPSPCPSRLHRIAEKVLDDFFETDEVARLKSLKSLMPFRNKFKKYVVENVDGLEQFFFHIMGRISQGKPALRLRRREQIIGCVTLSVNDNLLLVTEQGYGKRLPVSTLRLVNLGDLGTQALQFNSSLDNLVGIVPTPGMSKVVLLTSDERVVNLRLDSVKLWGKDGTGDRIAKINPEEKIISVAALV